VTRGKDVFIGGDYTEAWMHMTVLVKTATH